jgi:hypothetical protein
MPRATCRCGQTLTFPADGPDRVMCPACGSRLRVRRDPPRTGPGDGFIRFHCPCGRRLKVRSGGDTPMPSAGMCPDCGRVVPVPGAAASSSSAAVKAVQPTDPETRTAELSASDLAALDLWSRRFTTPGPAAAAPATAAVSAPEPPPATAHGAVPVPTPVPAAPTTRVEAGLRVCPRCGRPVHLGADTCRGCGAHVPRR